MTAYCAGTRGDGIRPLISSTEVKSLVPIGAPSGISVLAAAGKNGTGTGRIQIDATATMARYKAPGSSTWGLWGDLTTPDDMLLEDGDDQDKWVRLDVVTAFLRASEEMTVEFYDLYENAADDVTAAEASAGSVETLTVDLQDETGHGVETFLVWLDASTPDLEISDDGVVWVSPTTEGTALSFGNFTPAEIKTLHLRRTIGAAASSDPSVLNLLHASWTGA